MVLSADLGRLFSDLYERRGDEAVDCVDFIADQRSVDRCHVLVASLHSPVMYKMLSPVWGSSRTICLRSEDEVSILPTVLRFLYGFGVEVRSVEEAFQLSKFAEYYDIDSLRAQCSAWIAEQTLSVEECLQVIRCLPFDMPLVEHALWLLESRPFALFTSAAFLECTADEMCMILGRGLACREFDVFQALLLWSEHQCERDKGQGQVSTNDAPRGEGCVVRGSWVVTTSELQNPEIIPAHSLGYVCTVFDDGDILVSFNEPIGEQIVFKHSFHKLKRVDGVLALVSNADRTRMCAAYHAGFFHPFKEWQVAEDDKDDTDVFFAHAKAPPPGLLKLIRHELMSSEELYSCKRFLPGDVYTSCLEVRCGLRESEQAQRRQLWSIFRRCTYCGCDHENADQKGCVKFHPQEVEAGLRYACCGGRSWSIGCTKRHHKFMRAADVGELADSGPPMEENSQPVSWVRFVHKSDLCGRLARSTAAVATKLLPR